MNLQQAKAELKELADGEYHQISYTLTEYSSGRQENECQIYTDTHGFFSAPTFRQALTLLRKAKNPKRTAKGKARLQKTVIESISDAPRTTVQQYIDIKEVQ